MLSNRQNRRRWAALALLPTLACLSGCNTVNSQANNAEGVRLYTQGAYDQAAVKFQEAIASNPDSADGYYNLAASLHKAGAMYNRPEDIKQAEVLYNQCLERNPNHVECYRGLAVLLTETNRRDAAFRLLNNWNAASPQNPNPKIELARLLEETGQFDEAKAQLIAALEVAPADARAFTALGRLRDQAGEYQQALANYQRSLAINGAQPQVAARVATLQAAAAGAGPAAAAGAPSHVANQWQSSTTY
ncbi:cellulose synthase subunit BcsC [Posidoniimonas corsicana]|uniref:Cellulose synthase subunit BcsC n=1 Tax=Posidoniimonas corsicana TaxID=1938618 RepID=A0A5C5VCZ6_9BACT|nr:tetratricopeptide repeat protein [Posidoniimonas corsicana]TWT35850.1 cellulose synthase subunit BcsC [Posidoniimonas corsicana]